MKQIFLIFLIAIMAYTKTFSQPFQEVLAGISYLREAQKGMRYDNYAMELNTILSKGILYKYSGRANHDDDFLDLMKWEGIESISFSNAGRVFLRGHQFYNLNSRNSTFNEDIATPDDSGTIILIAKDGYSAKAMALQVLYLHTRFDKENERPITEDDITYLANDKGY